MCEFHTSTVMTTDNPQLRMTLRKMVNCVNNNPHTTRDPTFAREQFNNQARMPYIRNSNTLAAPSAAKRILTGNARPTESSSNNQPHLNRPTSMPIPRFKVSNRGYIYGYDYDYNYYNQTMGKQKGCLTRFKVTAPSGTIRTTSSDFASKQDRNPLAEGSGLGPRAIDEVDELFDEFRETPETNERPMVSTSMS